MSASLDCPHCAVALFRATKDGSRVKARTSILVLHKSGEVEINCPACSRGVLVPLVAIKDAPVVLKKADAQKFVVALDTRAPRRA